MSMYNAIHGVHSLCGTLLSQLEIKIDNCGRFRDCYFTRYLDKIVIAIYTRNGGNNREDYELATSRLRAHTDYIVDQDEEHDPTYASYFFNIPEFNRAFWAAKFKLYDSAGKLDEIIMPSAPERFATFLKKCEGDDQSDPEVQRALKLGSRLEETLKTSKSGRKLTIGFDGEITVEPYKKE